MVNSCCTPSYQPERWLGGSMIATELSDTLFGTPTPRFPHEPGRPQSGPRQHHPARHNPMLSEVIVAASQDPELLTWQRRTAPRHQPGRAVRTGNEVLMRQVSDGRQPSDAGAVIMTGAVEAMVVDYQCIMPA